MTRFSKRQIALYAIHLLFVFTCYAQVTRIKGIIRDAVTGEPISFANVFFKKTSVATIADDSGYFYLVTKVRRDSLTASFLGYLSMTKKIIRRTSQETNFDLLPNTTHLQEIVVVPGENPAHRIIRNIHKRKEFNNKKAHNMQCDIYNKISLSLSNIDEKFKKRRAFKNFQFVFENLDTNKVNGTVSLPLLITESSKKYYFQKNPPFKKDFVTASQISGIDNESLAEIAVTINHEFDIYDDNMTLYSESGFISPIADIGLLFYKYYLVDSTYKFGHKCYHIEFKSKLKKERTFNGDFWVADSTYAIQSMNMLINPDANLNFIFNLAANYEYVPINDSIWLLYKEHVRADINISEWKIIKGFQGDKTTIYTNYVVDRPIKDTVILKKGNITFADSVSNPQYMFRNRPVQLSEKEQKIYKMVDSVKNVPVFNTVYNILSTVFSGYYNFGKVNIGPYYSLYSYNKVEGSRFSFGGTTNAKLSNTFKLTGYLAYGTHDSSFKYFSNVIWILDRYPRLALSTTYRHDVSMINIAPGELATEGLISSFLRRTPFTKLQMLNNFSCTMEADLFEGVTNLAGINYLKIFQGPYIPFTKTSDSSSILYISTTQVMAGIHFESGQKFLQSKFKRARLRNNSPSFDFTATYGIKNVLQGKYDYVKLWFCMKQYLTLNPFGFNHYTIEAGKIFGRAPWPLLYIMKGNETYGLENNCYNMMNLYEFVADEYVSVASEQHFQGLFLNFIPLLRKLNLREVVSAKAVFGKLNDKNTMDIRLLSNMNVPDRPYVEMGIGIENIVKILRVDALWRLSYTKNPDIEVFGLRARFQFML